jgi:hypothetical protein
MSTIELTSGSATLTARAEYLLVVEHGTLTSAGEVLRYVSELELASQRYNLRRLLVDARSETDPGAGEARDAMWRWIRAQRAFDQIGFVLRDEMTIARVNMTSLSEKLVVRAFPNVADGHRWLARPRGASQTLQAVQAVRPAASSSVPPPPMNATPTPPPSAPQGARITQRLRAITESQSVALRPPTPSDPPLTRSHVTVKTAVVDEREADAILKKRR